MQEKVIVVDRVSKDFKLPHEKIGSIKNIFTNVFSFGKRTYENQHALHDISFEINKGEFFGIVGRNGSGKSTLLKILAGIYQPSKGQVHVGGRVVPFIELGVGFNGDLTGRENVYLNGALLGYSEKEIDAKYKDIVEFAELERFMDQRLKNYSSGMQVRLAFSVATRLAESDILLIDEVLAVGDANFQRKCFRYFMQLKKQKKTVVFVTHDMNAVREYCDRAVLIDKSELIKDGSPHDIAKMYEQILMPSDSGTGIANLDVKRWGDKNLSINNLKLKDNSSEKIRFTFELSANNDCEDPIIGFVVKNGAGVSVLGTSSVLSKVKLPKMKKGSTIQLGCEFINVLSDGDYTITLAGQYDGGLSNGDWWDDALAFSVNRSTVSPYLVDPGIKINLKKV